MRDAPEECEHVRELAMQIAKHFDWSQNVEHDIVLLWEGPSKIQSAHAGKNAFYLAGKAKQQMR